MAGEGNFAAGGQAAGFSQGRCRQQNECRLTTVAVGLQQEKRQRFLVVKCMIEYSILVTP